MKQCLFFWNGTEADGGGNFTLQTSTQPSAAVLRFRLGYNHREAGTLTLSDSVQAPRHFRGCRVARHVVTDGEGGRWREVTILDRRWRWGQGYAAIWGEYNRPPSRGNKTNPASYQELASKCLDALGETNYDVSALPHYRRQRVGNRWVNYPIGASVQWDGTNPADALRELCDQCGAEITLTLQDVVRLVPKGQPLFAPPLNDPRLMDKQLSVDPAIIPQNIVFEGGHTYIQQDLPLEAVGLEIKGPLKGQFVPISQLSYRPTNGWVHEKPGDFGGAGPGLPEAEKKRAIDVAREHIWKTYRVGGWVTTKNLNQNYTVSLPPPPTALQNRAGGRLTAAQREAVVNYFKIGKDDWWRVLPLESEQFPLFVSPEADASNEYEVLGFFNQIKDAAAKNNSYNGVDIKSHADIRANHPTALAFSLSRPIEDIPTPEKSTLRLPWGSTLNEETGVIKFAQNTYFVDREDKNKIYPALLRLRTTMRIRDPETAAFLCQQYWHPTNNPRSLGISKIVKKSDALFKYGYLGELGSMGVDTNEAQFTQVALSNLQADVASIRFEQGYSLPFKGFVFDYSPDSVVKAMAFDVAESGAGTCSMDYGVERSSVYTTLDELRQRRLVTYNAFLAEQIKQKQAAGVIKR